MSDIAIRVEHLSKRYRLGQREPYKSLRDVIARAAAAPVNWMRGRGSTTASNDKDYFWALDDISFEIKQGEAVGIIGRNGAGKSTLLKILSRITKPTKGRAEIYGRVGSLLEVGTGFHPELTGRENIYLNGAILGMKRSEIARKFDEIVDFAEIEKFLDTPVKRYSSGMYVRLAFAVAAHLEPEVLVVDEVLAVGDAQFQKKCLGKMGEVSQAGRTVLFVSHNMTAIRNLCQWTIWLQAGRIFQTSDTYAVVESYLRQGQRSESVEEAATHIKELPPDPAIRLEAVKIRQGDNISHIVLNGLPVAVEIYYTVLQRTIGLRVYFDLLDEDQNILIRSFHDDEAISIPTTEPGEYISTAIIPANLLAPRTYELRIRATIFNVRGCTADGIGVPLVVEATSEVNQGYPQDVIRSKLQPKIFWNTIKG